MLGTCSSSSSPAMPDQQDDSSQDMQTCFLDVVDLVLQHSDLLWDVRDFCRLLQTNTAVAAAAQQHCRGELQLAIGMPKQAAAAAPWLLRHGRCIGWLWMTCESEANAGPDPAASAAAAGQAVARALRQAAAQQAGSAAAQPEAGLQQLQSLVLVAPPSVAADLLQLVGGQLTWLDLTVVRPGDEAAMARAAAAVAALPGLQQLFLGNDSYWISNSMSVDCMVPALSSSSSLTSLYLCDVWGTLELQCMPSQLQSLTIHWCSGANIGTRLQLQHCTSLSKLELQGPVAAALASEDVLPVSLLELQLESITTLQPLMALTRLRTLSISDPPAAMELCRLTCLTNLTHIHLGYVAKPAASSAAWALLPALRHLRLFFDAPYSEGISSMAHLARATTLTSLALFFWDAPGNPVDAGGAVAALAAALPPLTNLQALHLGRQNFILLPPHPDLVAGWPLLLAAIKGLPRLQPDARAKCERFGQQLQEGLRSYEEFRGQLLAE